MKKVRYISGVLLRGTAFFLTGAWFCGIDRFRLGSYPKPTFELGDLAVTNVLKSAPPVFPTSFYFLIAGMVVVTVGAFFLFRYLRAREEEEEMEEVLDEQAKLILEAELENRGVEKEERKFLQLLCRSKDPVDLVPVVMSNEEFESRVVEHRNSKAFKSGHNERIYHLRRQLRFTFRNFERPFVCTQMLDPGLNFECRIRHHNREVSFMTTVLKGDDEGLYIKPPQVRGRPANLKQFREVRCKIRRGHEADYVFTLRVVRQLVSEMNAVVLAHSSDIQHRSIRESERLPISMEMDFNLVSEADYDLHEKFGKPVGKVIPLHGRIVDMSSGGMKVLMDNVDGGKLHQKDVLLYHLPKASMREDLASSVLSMAPKNQSCELHLKYVNVDRLTHMKLNQYLHRMKKHLDTPVQAA